MRADEETHQFEWYLVRETEKARCFSASVDGSNPFWVPRSLISHFSKYPANVAGEPYAMCLLEVPEWFAEKEGLL